MINNIIFIIIGCMIKLAGLFNNKTCIYIHNTYQGSSFGDILNNLFF